MRRIQLFCAVAMMHAMAASVVVAQPANLPNIGAAAKSQLQNRAAIRIPGVDASKASKFRAGSNFDPSRMRASASANADASAGVGNAANLRASSSTRAAVEARRQNDADNQSANSNQAERPDRKLKPENGMRLQTSVEFRTRLAEIDRMRDVAVERSDIELLQRADRLEHELMVQRAAQIEQNMQTRQPPSERLNKVNGFGEAPVRGLFGLQNAFQASGGRAEAGLQTATQASYGAAGGVAADGQFDLSGDAQINQPAIGGIRGRVLDDLGRLNDAFNQRSDRLEERASELPRNGDRLRDFLNDKDAQAEGQFDQQSQTSFESAGTEDQGSPDSEAAEASPGPNDAEVVESDESAGEAQSPPKK